MTKDEQQAAIAKLPLLAGMVDGSADLVLLLTTGLKIFFTGIRSLKTDVTGALWLEIELYADEADDEHAYFGFDSAIPGIVAVQVSQIVAIADRANGSDLAETCSEKGEKLQPNRI